MVYSFIIYILPQHKSLIVNNSMFIKKGQAARNKFPLHRPAAEKIFTGLKINEAEVISSRRPWHKKERPHLQLYAYYSFHYWSPKHLILGMSFQLGLNMSLTQTCVICGELQWLFVSIVNNKLPGLGIVVGWLRRATSWGFLCGRPFPSVFYQCVLGKIWSS